MGLLKKLVFCAALAAMASCAVVDDPASEAQQSSLQTDDNAAFADDGAATAATCMTSPRRICTTPILCENGDGVPSSGTCPSGRICCLFASPE